MVEAISFALAATIGMFAIAALLGVWVAWAARYFENTVVSLTVGMSPVFALAFATFYVSFAYG